MTDESSEHDPDANRPMWEAPEPYSAPPPTSPPTAWSYPAPPQPQQPPYGAGAPAPQGYGYGYPPQYQPQYPTAPYPGYGYAQPPPPVGPPVALGYGPQHGPVFVGQTDPGRLRITRLVAILAQVSLVLPVIAQFAAAHAIGGQRDALRRALQELNDTGFVNMADAHHADDVARNASLYSIGALILAGAFVTWWLWRVREDADLFDPYVHRRAKGWVIGGWIVPIVSFWFPYQIVSDVAKANQPLPTGYDERRVPTVVKLWWAAFLLLVIGARVVVFQGDSTVQDFATETKLAYAAGVWSIVAAALAVLVIEQLTRSNAARWNALATAPSAPAPGHR